MPSNSSFEATHGRSWRWQHGEALSAGGSKEAVQKTGNVSSSTPSMPVAGTDGHLHAFAPAWYHGQQDTRQGRTREGVLKCKLAYVAIPRDESAVVQGGAAAHGKQAVQVPSDLCSVAAQVDAQHTDHFRGRPVAATCQSSKSTVKQCSSPRVFRCAQQEQGGSDPDDRPS